VTGLELNRGGPVRGHPLIRFETGVLTQMRQRAAREMHLLEQPTWKRIVTAVYLLLMIVVCTACEPQMPNDLPSLMEAMNSNSETISVNASNKVSENFGREGLLTVLRTGGPMAKARAARWLWRFPNDEVEQALVLIVENERDSFLRSQALQTLGETGTSKALPVVEAASRSPDQLVSFSATDAMRLIRGRMKRDD
jgi:HEAT repeat protein